MGYVFNPLTGGLDATGVPALGSAEDGQVLTARVTPGGPVTTNPTYAALLALKPCMVQGEWLPNHDFSLPFIEAGMSGQGVDYGDAPIVIIKPAGQNNYFAANYTINAGPRFTGSTEPDWSSAPNVGNYVNDGEGFTPWYNIGPTVPPSEVTTWAPVTEYPPCAVVAPTVPNGHLYMCYPDYADNGEPWSNSTGATEPDWSSSYGFGTYIEDGSTYWMDLGVDPSCVDVVTPESRTTEWADSTGGGGGVTLSEEPPASPTVGMDWVKTSTGRRYTWDGDQWIEFAAGAPSTTGVTGRAKIVSTTFYYNTPGLTDGIVIYEPKAGDILLDAWVEVQEGWNGIQLVDINTFVGATTGLYHWFDDAHKPNLGVADSDGLGGGLLLATSQDAANSISGVQSAYNGHYYELNRAIPAKFTGEYPLKIVVSQTGQAGGPDPGATQGRAVAHVMVWCPDEDAAIAAPTDVTLKRTVTITTAQLLDLHNTPVEIVPAAGVGKFILPISLYVAASGMALGVEGTDYLVISSGSLAPTCIDYGIVQDGGSQIWVGGAAPQPSGGYIGMTAPSDQPLLLYRISAFTDPGGADTTLKVTVIYTIIDI